MAEIGWSIIPKNIKKRRWWGHIPSRLLAIHLILSVNWRREEWWDIELEEGQIACSVKGLADEIGITTKELRGAIEKLTTDNFMGKQTTNRYTVLTLCDYDAYKGVKNTEGKQRANEGQTKGKQRATIKINKENNIKRSTNVDPKNESFANSENSSPQQPPKNPPPEEKSSAKKERPNIEQRQKQFEYELEPYKEIYGEQMVRSFCDYWSEPTQGDIPKMKKELQRTWSTESRLRTWKSNETKFNNNDTASKRTTSAGATTTGYREHHEARIANNLAEAIRDIATDGDVQPIEPISFDFEL